MTKNELDLENKKRVIEYGEREYELDCSLACQSRWEQKFPEMADAIDLVSFTEKISGFKEASTALIISELKIIYCYLETEQTFLDFLKMFDLTNPSYCEKLTNRIKSIFDVVFSEASEKN